MHKYCLSDLFLFVFVILIIPTPVLAWGPEIHFYLASRLMELSLVGGIAERIISKHRKQFLFGNVIADLVIGKSYIRSDDHSHSWSIIDRLDKNADTDKLQAFSLGIRAHLAADTIAHNQFVPDWNGRIFPSTKSGHTYWEIKAGSYVPAGYRRDLRDLLEEDFSSERELYESSLRHTILPFDLNWLITSGLLKLHSHHNWHRVTNTIEDLSSFSLEDEIDYYFALSIDRMRDSMGEPNERESVRELSPI